MKRSKTYRKTDADLTDRSASLFEGASISFAKSKEEVWSELSEKLGTSAAGGKSTGRVITMQQRLAMAATLALLLSVGTFFRLYTVNTSNLSGENITVELPDGSLAELNENTSLRYHPLWWPVSRNVQLEGEAFFQVKEGRRFEVRTSLAMTEVLGTTFTVYAVDDRFSVTCHSGRVRVSRASSDQSVILSMNKRADLIQFNGFEVSPVSVEPRTPAWESKLLMFASTPLREVLDEIESQFGIRIETPDNLNYIYTGNFKLDQSPEKILSLICRPFDLVYEKQTASEYTIFPSPVD